MEFRKAVAEVVALVVDSDHPDWAAVIRRNWRWTGIALVSAIEVVYAAIAVALFFGLSGSARWWALLPAVWVVSYPVLMALVSAGDIDLPIKPPVNDELEQLGTALSEALNRVHEALDSAQKAVARIDDLRLESSELEAKVQQLQALDLDNAQVAILLRRLDRGRMLAAVAFILTAIGALVGVVSLIVTLS